MKINALPLDTLRKRIIRQPSFLKPKDSAEKVLKNCNDVRGEYYYFNYCILTIIKKTILS